MTQPNEGLVRVLVDNLAGRRGNEETSSFILAAWPGVTLAECLAANAEARCRLAAERSPPPSLSEIAEWLAEHGVCAALPWRVPQPVLDSAMAVALDLASMDADARKAGL